MRKERYVIFFSGTDEPVELGTVMATSAKKAVDERWKEMNVDDRLAFGNDKRLLGAMKLSEAKIVKDKKKGWNLVFSRKEQGYKKW